MPDILLSSLHLLERLGLEEQQLRRLGLHAHAEGVRAAITILIREAEAAGDQPATPPAHPATPPTE